MADVKSFDKFGPWAGFALQTINKSVEAVRALAGRGTEVVEKRKEGFKADDPEIIRVDKHTEGIILGEVEKAGIRATALSEEAGKIQINSPKPEARSPKPAFGDQEVYLIVDPFDGSMLYRRQIPAFWFTAMAFYSLAGEPLASVVADIIAGTVDFANEEAAFSGKLSANGVISAKQVKPNKVTTIADAFLETYLMKPAFLYPSAITFEPLFSNCKFVLPNGGPAGWADVASGKVDIYLALKEASTEVFTGMAIAERAGATISTFDGNPVTFSDDFSATYSLICTATPELHQEVLQTVNSLEGIKQLVS